MTASDFVVNLTKPTNLSLLYDLEVIYYIDMTKLPILKLNFKIIFLQTKKFYS